MSGATGCNAGFINHTFKATAESVNSARVFPAVGDSRYSLWKSTSGNWMIGRASEKGKASGYAYVTNGESPLSQSAEWTVYNGNEWVTESRVSAQECSEHELVCPLFRNPTPEQHVHTYTYDRPSCMHLSIRGSNKKQRGGDSNKRQRGR